MNGKYKRTPEIRAKQRASMLGRKSSQETRGKISKAQKGRALPETWKRNISSSKMDAKNPNWKGDKVRYKGLHLWIRSRLKRPNHCPVCKKRCVPDLANISQEYKRDITDWEWLCRRCHMKKDGRLAAWIKARTKK